MNPEFLQSLVNAKVFLDKATFHATPILAEPPTLAYGSLFSCTIGRYCHLGGSLIGDKTTIGRYSQSASGTQIGVGGHPTNWLSTHFFQYRDCFEPYPADHSSSLLGKFDETAPTTIGSDVWIGAMAFIKSGVTVGHGAIVAAGAVVVKDVEPYAIVGGNPAKLIRYRFPKPVIERLLAIRWWELEHEAICRLPFNEIERCLDILEQRQARGELPRLPPRYIRIQAQ